MAKTGEAVSQYLEMISRATPNRAALPRRSIKFADFRQTVRRYRPSDLLPALAALAVTEGDPPYSMHILRSAPPWAIALVARESILYGNDYRRKVVTGDDLRNLFNAHNSVHDGNDQANESGLLSMLTRAAYEQFPYQESIFEEVSRAQALLVECLDDVEAEILDDKAWQRLLGAPLGQIVGATFLLHVVANENAGWVDLKLFDDPELEPIFDHWPRQVIEHCTEELSYTFDEFRTSYESVEHPVGYERYAFNPLTARPFVRMPDGRLLAPQPRLILRTISPGALYYRGIREFGAPFARDLGRLTERYVGRQLESIDEAVDLQPEITYGKPEKKSVDWLLILPSVVIMIEVKSTRFALLDRAGVHGFEQRANSLLDRSLAQLERTSEAIDDGLPEFAHIPGNLPRIGIVVTSEPYYLANSPWVRHQLRQTSFPTLTASLREIETLSGLPIREIERHLVAIANDPERSTWSLGSALPNVAVRGHNKVLQRAWDSYPWLGEIESTGWT